MDAVPWQISDSYLEACNGASCAAIRSTAGAAATLMHHAHRVALRAARHHESPSRLARGSVEAGIFAAFTRASFVPWL
jgi:hypothetical protein